MESREQQKENDLFNINRISKDLKKLFNENEWSNI